ncbi:MAG: murein biosynthesis integral membrane protein MurJ [Candidatus Aminicenantes bacterium]|nr:murein biosynthesis integral membrane protein MurJ [Candidatus Aminicenantes bacterium]
MKKLRVIFTGGGTGGHVYPNIAIYEALYKASPDSEFLYVGTEKGAESTIVKNIERPIRFKSVHSRGIPQKIKSFGTLISLLHIGIGAIQSFFILRKFKPDIIIGSGGYVAAPVLIAASILKLKILIHEQNAIPGRLNRFMARAASKVAVSFRSTLKYFPEKKGIYSGYPLRDMIKLKDNDKIREKLGIPLNNKVVFIFGGSKGARTINNAVVEILPELLDKKDLTVILSTGRGSNAEYRAYEDTLRLLKEKQIDPEKKNNLIIREYFDNIDEIYSVSDIVVSRAGAGSVEELTRLGIPSLLIPKIDLPGDHQIVNAKEVEKSGGARVLFEEISFKNDKTSIKVPERKLLSILEELLDSDDQLSEMRKNLKGLDREEVPVNIILELITKLTDINAKNEEEEIVSYYLHSPEDEQNYELMFSNTTFGNSFLSSYYINIPGKDFVFEIKIISNDEKLLLRKIKGSILLNGSPPDKISEIFEGDEIEVNGRKFIIHRYTETVEKFEDTRRTEAKVLSSSLGITLSRIGGFFREILILGLFGARSITDIYVAGLTISNLMRRVVAENAMENAFLPIFMRLFRRTPREKMWRSTSSILNFTLLFAILISLTGIIFAPSIVGFIYSGFESKGVLSDAVAITRIMFPYLILVTVAAIFSTILKAFNRFGIAEFSSLFFSVGSIIGILALYSISHIYALGFGVLLGGFLHMFFLYPFVKKILKNKSLQFKYSLSIDFSSAVNKKYYSQLIPISLDVFLSKTAEIVDQFLAASLYEGSLSYLYFAKTIFRLPFAIISQAINSVILRDFSDKIALFDKKKAKKLFIDGVKLNIFLLAPVSILMLMLADPIVSVLYGRGKFLAGDISKTAFALQFYSIGLVGWGLHSLTSRIFSARIDIKTSMYINFIMLISNVLLSFYLVSTDLEYAGLALATTISFVLFSIIRIVVLKFKLSGEDIKIKFRELTIPLLKTMGASLMMVIVMIQSKTIFSLIDPGSKTLKDLILIISLTFVGIGVYLIASLLLKNTDIFILKKRKVTHSDSMPLPMSSPFGFLERVSIEPLKYSDDFCYKINIFLNSPKWEIRNVGIKLIGLFRDKSKLNFLLKTISERKENGFIIRNSVNSLGKIMEWGNETKEVLLKSIEDKYYEVRVSSIKVITGHFTENDYKYFNSFARSKFDRSVTEEKLAYIKLMSVSGTLDELNFLTKYFLSENSLIREELLKMVLSFYRKDILNKVDVIKYTDRILLTSNNMKPHFRIKSILNEIHSEINKV